MSTSWLDYFKQLQSRGGFLAAPIVSVRIGVQTIYVGMYVVSIGNDQPQHKRVL